MKKKIKFKNFFAFVAVILLNLILTKAISSAKRVNKTSEIHIVSYNLQNLFDTKHDEGKNDWEFLPKNLPEKKEGCTKAESKERYRQKCMETDWTEAKLNIKYEKIKEVITAVNPELPDILAVQEVENKSVLLELARKLGYHAKNVFLEEGPDKRGIDVGILFKEDHLKHILTKTVPINLRSGHSTRDLLITYFGIPLKGETHVFSHIMSVYNVHWPSQRAKTEARTHVSQQIKAIIDEDRRKYGNIHVVILGDFNTTYKEEDIIVKDEEGNMIPNPIKGVLLKSEENSKGLVDTDSFNKRKNNPKGTYFYSRDQRWSLFDRILISQSLMGQGEVSVIEDSYEIHNYKFLSYFKRCYRGYICDKDYYIPRRYDIDETEPDKVGYSDHYPVSIKLLIRK